MTDLSQTSAPETPQPLGGHDALVGSAPPQRTPGGLITLDHAREVAERVRARIRESIMGRDDVIELVLVALFSNGHVLLEDYPGSGKTTLAKALGDAIVEDSPADSVLPAFRRVQFTPDLLPSDVTGTLVFEPETNQFHFRRGPVFAHVLLVDEINRTSPKVQSALLEAMAEAQVTVDNVSYPLDDLFFVIATQNPLDLIGTYPLPIAQLDRFLFKVRMEHIDRASELAVLDRWGVPQGERQLPAPVTRTQVVEAREVTRSGVAVAAAIRMCLVDTARRLRDDKRVLQGVSTRSLVLAIPALQTLAMLRGRDHVTGADVEQLAVPLFGHRLELIPGVDDMHSIVGEALAGPIDALSRSTLR